MNMNYHAADPKLIKAILEQFNFSGGNTPENEIIVTAHDDKINERDKGQYQFRVLNTTRAMWENNGCEHEQTRGFWVKLTKTGKVKSKSLLNIKYD